jgi:acylpyruvate hydrolase
MKLHRPTSAPIAAGTVDATTWISYLDETGEHFGVRDADTVVPLAGLRRLDANTPAQLLRNAPLDLPGRRRLSDVTLLPASPHPRKVIGVGVNYRLAGSTASTTVYPVLFSKFASNLIAGDADIELPPESRQVDYEGELAVVIGTPGRRIAEADALDHVLGYTVANDITMRDFQARTHQWLPGKAWDRSTPLGPGIVAADAVDLGHARIRTTVNDRIAQDSDLSHMIFQIPQLIAIISELTILEAGDVILTGTPEGTGCRAQPPHFLSEGDTVTVDITGVGIIHNTVVSEAATARWT